VPRRKVAVKSHERGRPRGSGYIHVDRYSRTQDLGSRQYDLEEVLGPKCDVMGRNDPEGEACSQCGYQSPVYQRNISGEPIYRECHDSRYQGQVQRRLEHEKRDRAIDRRLGEWDRWQYRDPVIRRSGD